MSSNEYLELSMYQLSHILYNGSQSNSVSKNMILDGIKGILEDYKRASGNNVNIKDFRSKE